MLDYPFNPDELHLRPRFSFNVPYSVERILEKIQLKLNEDNAPCKGSVVTHHVILDIPIKDRHYWSPQLHLEVEEDEEKEKGSLVRGIIGPRPAVWTLFLFIYAVIGIIGLMVSLYGLSKWSLGEFSIALFGLPIAFVLMSSAYLTSRYGEKLGHEQVEILKDFLRAALKND
ncbi:MAG: hypothetical protein R3E32_01180 [Chitinophagales bacterium]